MLNEQLERKAVTSNTGKLEAGLKVPLVAKTKAAQDPKKSKLGIIPEAKQCQSSSKRYFRCKTD
jgi:hypothetical protein